MSAENSTPAPTERVLDASWMQELVDFAGANYFLDMDHDGLDRLNDLFCRNIGFTPPYSRVSRAAFDEFQRALILEAALVVDTIGGARGREMAEAAIARARARKH
jgi:hypothetical protein